jgi:predicted dehydrogenase/threonine dehydrogenase-like Zn-dependent dehydrogenase
MKQVAQTQRDGRLQVLEVPAPLLRPRGVLVRTAYSLISAGTERSKVEVARKNLLGKALARPDQVRQVLDSVRQTGISSTFQKVSARLDSFDPLGYSCAGLVVEVGTQTEGFAPGNRVACAGVGYANHAEINYIPQNLCVRVPGGVGLDEAAFTTLGAIALQGIRQAGPTLGETVGVIGLGLLGLLTVELLRAAGCHVLGIDVNAGRCELAQQLGADHATTPDDTSLEALARRFSPAGLDAMILTAATKSSDPIALAGKLARDRARIVVVGAVGMDLPRSPFYEKELDLRLSRSYGPGRYDPQYEEKGIDYPIGYVRWTEGRNLASFLDLIAEHKVDVRPLITHRFPLSEAERAYALIEGKIPEPYLGVLLDYGLPVTAEAGISVSSPTQVKPVQSSPNKLGLALVGAGSFAQSMLLPHLKGFSNVRLHTVADASGLTARSVAERAGFEQCVSNVQEVFDDPDIRLVVIASRHNSHADLVVRGLQAGKAVFVEKPLALSPNQLQQVIDAHSSSSFLMLGFNRRFAPLVVALRKSMEGAGEPLLVNYRVNAGYVPRTHWTQDAEEGGGRIIGEVCHFVDLITNLIGHPPVQVFASTLPDRQRYNSDNLAAILRFADGSIGTISYVSNGDRGLAKERVEVFGGGRVAVLDDFKQLALYVGGKCKVKKSSPDKGHCAEMQALVEAVRKGLPSPIPFEQSVLATRTTFATLNSLATGQPVSL